MECLTASGLVMALYLDYRSYKHLDNSVLFIYSVCESILNRMCSVMEGSLCIHVSPCRARCRYTTNSTRLMDQCLGEPSLLRIHCGSILFLNK